MQESSYNHYAANLRPAGSGLIKSARGCAALVGLLALAWALAGCGGESDGDEIAEAPVVVAPLALPGPYAVACSNVAQDFARVPAGESAQDFWEGTPAADGTPRFVASLLVDPVNALNVTVNVPNDASLYGSFAGKPVGYVVLACYPTAASNPRPAFALPTGQVVPHMQMGAEAPLFADAAARYPVMAFSHGLVGSPLSGDHLVVLAWLASYGYVVVAPFHGDPRFADLQIDDFGDVVNLLSELADFIALQALRPLSVSAALDLVLAHPQWRDHVDATQIGGFGVSMGGETMMLLGGAGLTKSAELDWSPVGVDLRIKAAVGYIPYFGQPLLPAFGRDQNGLDGVTLPYLAISGTADTTAPLLVTQQGIAKLPGTRALVSLVDVVHGFDPVSAGDIMTWTLTFLDAQVRGLPAARAQLATMTSVSGGVEDEIVIGPTPP
jgi:predicted dienelactone hydrolase